MKEVLKYIGKKELFPKFINQDIVNLIVYLQLTDKDLEKMGLSDGG